MKVSGFPLVLSGYKRQWVKCNDCGRVAYYDFVPFSLSNPIMTLPCGHGAAVKFYNAVVEISEHEAMEALITQSKGGSDAEMAEENAIL